MQNRAMLKFKEVEFVMRLTNSLKGTGVGTAIGACISYIAASPTVPSKQQGYMPYFVQAVSDLGCKYFYDPKTMTEDHKFDGECSNTTVARKVWDLANERFKASPDYKGDFNWLYFGSGLAVCVAIGAFIGYVYPIESYNIERRLREIIEKEEEKERQEERLMQIIPVKAKKEERVSQQPAAFFHPVNSLSSGVPVEAPPAYEEDKAQDKQGIRFQLAG